MNSETNQYLITPADLAKELGDDVLLLDCRPTMFFEKMRITSSISWSHFFCNERC